MELAIPFRNTSPRDENLCHTEKNVSEGKLETGAKLETAQGSIQKRMLESVYHTMAGVSIMNY